MRFQCPVCKGIVAVDNTDLGLPVQCGLCNEIVTVPDSRVAPGAVIGDFIIQQELGRGGMGVVYLSHQISLDRSAALKVLSDQLANDSQFVNNFIREARAAAKLNHSYIVQAYAVGEDEGVFYFAMEDIGGKTMKDVLAEQKKLPCDQALLIVQQIAEALNYAWVEQKLIHRDIKPDNIMLTASGRAKLSDLGLASIGEETHSENSDEIMGTPQYISPEHLTGAPTDGRSDIYSLGATLYHFVTGRFPYNGKTVNEIAAQHLHGTLIPPHKVNPEIPLDVSRLIMRMMERNPQNRYQSAAELLDDIRAIRHASDSVTASIHLPPVSSSGGEAPGPEKKKVLKKSSDGKKLRMTSSQTVSAAGAKNRPGVKRKNVKGKKKISDGAKQWIITGSIFGVLLIVGIVAVVISATSRPQEVEEKLEEEVISEIMAKMQALAGISETANMTAGKETQRELLEQYHTDFAAIMREYDPAVATDQEKAVYNNLLAYYMKAHSFFENDFYEKSVEAHKDHVRIYREQYDAVKAAKDRELAALEAEKRRIEEEKRERERRIEAEKRELARIAREKENNRKHLASIKSDVQKKLDATYSVEKSPEELKALFENAIKPCLESKFLESEDMELRNMAKENEKWAQELLNDINGGLKIVNLRKNAYADKTLAGLDLRIGGKVYKIILSQKGILQKKEEKSFAAFPLKEDDIKNLKPQEEEFLVERLAEKEGLSPQLWAYYLLMGKKDKARELNAEQVAKVLSAK